VKPIFWVAITSLVSAAVLGAQLGREVWLGMFAPLVVVSITWTLTERIYRANPERLTSVMISAFAAKLVFFGAYVGLAIGVLGVKPISFAASLTGYFIALHVIEALWLKRLFVADVANRRGA
jgi:hypothetical protein